MQIVQYIFWNLERSYSHYAKTNQTLGLRGTTGKILLFIGMEMDKDAKISLLEIGMERNSWQD